jgi:hypothetical protein
MGPLSTAPRRRRGVASFDRAHEATHRTHRDREFAADERKPRHGGQPANHSLRRLASASALSRPSQPPPVPPSSSATRSHPAPPPPRIRRGHRPRRRPPRGERERKLRRRPVPRVAKLAPLRTGRLRTTEAST